VPNGAGPKPDGGDRATDGALAAHGALLVVQVLFGLWPVVGVIALRVLTPPALVGVRLAVGAPILAIAAGLHKKPLPARGDLLRLAGLAALGISINQLLFVEGLAHAGHMHASVLGLLIPPFTVAIAALLGREHPSRIRLVGLAVAVLGAAILVRPDRLGLSRTTLLGDAFLVCNTAAYSAYLVLARGPVARLGALTTVAWVMVLGAIEAAPFVALPLYRVPWSTLDASVVLALAFVVVGATVFTYLLNAFALGRVPASVVAIYCALQPLVAAVAGIVLLGTPPTADTGLAAAVLVVGVILATR
jgi:drug/metabolite transporter (DMT)-like permease